MFAARMTGKSELVTRRSAELVLPIEEEPFDVLS